MNDITIVIATYNRPAYLQEMLRSVLEAADRVPNKVKLVVIDDHSDTIETKNVVYDFGLDKIDYYRLPENRGVAGALYAGFQHVDTEFYALWGDDDVFLPNWFTLHLAKIAEGFDVVAGSYWRTDANLNRKKRAVILPVATLDDLMEGHNACNDGALVRTERALPFRPDRERAMMMTFWMAMLAAGRTFGVVEKPTWLYRRHTTNLSLHRSEHDNELRRQAIAEYA